MEYNVKSVIGNLQALHHIMQKRTMTQSRQTQTSNQDTLQLSTICILPKSVIRRIFLFLDFQQDLSSVMQSCKLFNTLVRSRPFQIEAFKQNKTMAAPAEKIKTQTQTGQITSLQQALAQLAKANAVNNFLAQAIKTENKTKEDLQADINRLNDDLRIQKQINSKFMNKVSTFQQKFQLAQASEKAAKERLEILAEEQKEESLALSNQILSLEKQNKTLVEHKRVLRSEVMRLRKEYQQILLQLGNYRDAVFKMRSYFEALVMPRIESAKKN